MDISHIRAVIFDMDGVFFDTEPLMFEAFRRVFKLHGLDLSDEYQYKFIGYPTIKSCAVAQPRAAAMPGY